MGIANKGQISAYIAGFFDGEGCVQFTPDRRCIQLCIVQKYPEPLIFIKGIYGGRVLKSMSGGFVIHRYYILGKETQIKFINDILPFTIVKKEQLEMALLFLATVTRRGGGGKLTDKQLKDRLEIVEEFRGRFRQKPQR